MRFIIQLLLVCCFALPSAAAEGPTKSANEFTIRAGDVLQITVWKEDGMDRELVVLPDGTITFPLIGTVVLQDLTLVGAQDIIK
jgi:polysaccharide biosynthesis/export protein